MATPQQPDLLSRTNAPVQNKPTKTAAKAEVIPPTTPKQAQAIAPRKGPKRGPVRTTAVSTKVAKLPEATPANMMQAMMQAVMNPAFDADKLKLIMEQLHKQQDREAETKFNAAMLACQEELPTVIKDSKGDKAKYAKLEKIMNMCMPIIRKHGFSPSWSTEDSPIAEHYRVICYLSHAPSGFTRRYQWDLTNDSKGPEGKPNKTLVQGFGSTMSYGQRYGLRMMFNITLAGEDNDGAKQSTTEDPNRPLTADQIKQITALMKKKALEMPDMIKWLRTKPGCGHVETLADLPSFVTDKGKTMDVFAGIMHGLNQTPDA